MSIITAQPAQRTTTPPGTTKYLKLSQDQKRAHVEAYMKSHLTKKAYCEQEGLKRPSFKNWMTRYGGKKTSNFVPVVSTPPRSAPYKGPHIEICKGDCKVTLSDIANVKVAVEIIKGVFACN